MERVGWMVKSSRRYLGWKDTIESCRVQVSDKTFKWILSGIFSQWSDLRMRVM